MGILLPKDFSITSVYPITLSSSTTPVFPIRGRKPSVGWRRTTSTPIHGWWPSKRWRRSSTSKIRWRSVVIDISTSRRTYAHGSIPGSVPWWSGVYHSPSARPVRPLRIHPSADDSSEGDPDGAPASSRRSRHCSRARTTSGGRSSGASTETATVTTRSPRRPVGLSRP